MTDDGSDAPDGGELADVQLPAEGELPRSVFAYARERIASLTRYSRNPPDEPETTLGKVPYLRHDGDYGLVEPG